MMSIKSYVSILTVCGLVSLAGCSRGGAGVERSIRTYAVKGKVVFADGKPLTGGVVHFVPKKGSSDQAVGEIESDGSFQLTTRKLGDGAAPGEYKVYIDPVSPRMLSDKSVKPVPIPPKFKDEDKSGIVVVIKAEAVNLDPIRLK